MSLSFLNSIYHLLETNSFNTEDARSKDSDFPLTMYTSSLLAVGLLAIPVIVLTGRTLSKMMSKESSIRSAHLIKDLSVQAPPSREEFIRAVQQFEETHQVTLQNLLTGLAWNARSLHEDVALVENSELLALRESFFEDPIIQGYLSRSSFFVRFLQNRPEFIDDPNDPENSDHLECRIYQLIFNTYRDFSCASLAPPYRELITKDEFYVQGTLQPTIFQSLLTKNSSHYKVIASDFSKDPDRIKNFIRKLELGTPVNEIKQCQEIQFLLFANTSEFHSTTIISIIQKESFKHLTSIFMNSINSQSAYLQAKGHFNARNEFCKAFLLGKEAENMYCTLSEKLNGHSLFIDEKKREGYILNPSRGFVIEDRSEQAIYDALENGSIDVIHGFPSGYADGRRYAICGGRPLHLINASHDLQTNPEDGNCSIYSLNFLQGIVQMLENSREANAIYELAERVSLSSDPEKKVAEERIAEIFTKDLRRYLPAYYDVTGEQRLYVAIKEHHLHQRWDLGSEGMKPERLAATGYLPQKAPPSL